MVATSSFTTAIILPRNDIAGGVQAWQVGGVGGGQAIKHAPDLQKTAGTQRLVQRFEAAVGVVLFCRLGHAVPLSPDRSVVGEVAAEIILERTRDNNCP